MKRKIIYILGFSVLIIILITILNLSKAVEVIDLNNSVVKINLRKSEEKIRGSILKITPLDISMEDVLKIIDNNKKWKNEYESFEIGYGMMTSGPTMYYSERNVNFVEIVGVKSIKVYIGGYRTIFEHFVEVYWGFDENEKLIEVGIRKTSNSL